MSQSIAVTIQKVVQAINKSEKKEVFTFTRVFNNQWQMENNKMDRTVSIDVDDDVRTRMAISYLCGFADAMGIDLDGVI